MINVIGIGNPDSGDDALGWRVAERMRHRTSVVLSTADPARLIGAWHGRGTVVVVDATRGGGPPGTVTVIDLLSDHPTPPSLTSTHGWGLAQAVELGRALGALPATLTLVGVEASCFEPGSEPSPDVTRGIEQAVRLIRSWCDAPDDRARRMAGAGVP